MGDLDAARLVAEGLLRRFGGVVALDIDRFEVADASIVGLIGPNGAGKTTLFDILTGFVPPDAGAWSLDGRQLRGSTAAEIARAGLVRTFQLTRLLPQLTVLDNLRVAVPGQHGERLLGAVRRRSWRREEAEVTATALELLEWVGLAGRAAALASELSGGEAKLLELGRVLAAGGSVLLLDEPFAGVSPALVERLAERVASLPERGTSAVLIEHDVQLVASVADEVVCLDRGRIIARGDPGAVLADDRVAEAYLGGGVAT